MSRAENPAAFGTRGTFALIVAGFVAFLVLLAWLGTGEQPGNNGGAHGQGKGIAGYAALASMLAAEGYQVGFNRAPQHNGGRELVVLTPLPTTEAKDLSRIIDARRAGLGPTILILPKWITLPLGTDPRPPQDAAGKAWARVFGPPRAPQGWTTIMTANTPAWPGLLDRIGVHLGTARSTAAHGWRSGGGASGPLPDDHQVQSGGGFDDDDHPLVPLVQSGDGRVLAGYLADGGAYPGLDAMAGVDPATADAISDVAANGYGRQPLVIVFEPDLLNNRGLANEATALNAQKLVLATAGRGVPRVVFDLSLAGLGAPRNLLTLAFSPPFLAATICLIIAMAGVLWRGFARFGPARATDATVQAGKLALVAGGGALLLRARRHHLIAGPYADAARERLITALGLPRRRPVAETDGAIERIQRSVAPDTAPFGEAVARLAAATSPAAIAAEAAHVHHIETTLAHASRKGGS